MLRNLSVTDEEILVVAQKAATDEKEAQIFIKRMYKVRQINRESEYRHNKSHSEVLPVQLILTLSDFTNAFTNFSFQVKHTP